MNILMLIFVVLAIIFCQKDEGIISTVYKEPDCKGDAIVTYFYPTSKCFHVPKPGETVYEEYLYDSSAKKITLKINCTTEECDKCVNTEITPGDCVQPHNTLFDVGMLKKPSNTSFFAYLYGIGGDCTEENYDTVVVDVPKCSHIGQGIYSQSFCDEEKKQVFSGQYKTEDCHDEPQKLIPVGGFCKDWGPPYGLEMLSCDLLY